MAYYLLGVWGAAIVSVVAAVVAAWSAHRIQRWEQKNDVEELASLVERLYREQRRERMRRVRAGPGPGTDDAPPELTAPPETPLDRKAALRLSARQRGLI